MANLTDYLKWRGDLTFEASPFSEIDALVLCQISYLHFDGLLSKDSFTESVCLGNLYKKFTSAEDYERRIDVGLLINKKTVEVLKLASESVRFKDVSVTGYVSILDPEKEEQFTAFTYKITNKRNYVCYRGTDDTLVGWKEDFNLAIEEQVPAQQDAKKYLEDAMKALKGDFTVGGHSKGGNLAIFASAMSNPKNLKRIKYIYNFDGPGFTKKRIKSQEFYQIIPLIRSYYPQLSIVGMLFEHAGEYRVVESDPAGIMSHDPFKWHILGREFVTLENFDKETVVISDSLNTWMNQLKPEQTAIFVDTLFKIIKSTGAKTNTEFEENKWLNSIKIANAIRKLDPELRKIMEAVVKDLFKAITDNVSWVKNRQSKKQGV